MCPTLLDQTGSHPYQIRRPRRAVLLDRNTSIQPLIGSSKLMQSISRRGLNFFVKRLEFVDQVHAEKQLIPRLSVVVRLQVPRVIKAELRTEHNRGADVSAGIQRIFRIFRSETRTLPFLIVEQVRPKSEHELGADFAI